MKILIRHKGRIISKDILIAESFMSRLIGLMFREKLVGADGLMLDPCRSIHTFFMRYNIDVVFMSRKNAVIKISQNLIPWRMTWMYCRASKTLEMPAGQLPLDIYVGDVLEVENV